MGTKQSAPSPTAPEVAAQLSALVSTASSALASQVSGAEALGTALALPLGDFARPVRYARASAVPRARSVLLVGRRAFDLAQKDFELHTDAAAVSVDQLRVAARALLAVSSVEFLSALSWDPAHLLGLLSPVSPLHTSVGVVSHYPAFIQQLHDAKKVEEGLVGCQARGTPVRTLRVLPGNKTGMAVSADERWLVIAHVEHCTLSVYSLPGCELVRTMGGRGTGPLQFNFLRRVCFAPNGNMLAVDVRNRRLQEVTLEGVFVRTVSCDRLFKDADPFSVAVHDDVIAVGCYRDRGPGVVLFGYLSGTVISSFGSIGISPGQLSPACTGLRFTPDGGHLVVVEWEARRASLFTIGGVFIRCVGASVLGGGDVGICVSGEIVVAAGTNHRVCVFDCTGQHCVRSWGCEGDGEGQFQRPTALAVVGQYLYVLDKDSDRVQVFK